ncbi:MAG: homocysteine S-methyltransferase family protein [Clostridiales bacterium]|nr:homocysteine S-methyltransferase family protein [Clostridiales bacterium]
MVFNLGEKMMFFDGGMGSVLQKMGLKTGELPELLCINEPEKISSIHAQYIKSGANFITTNTFGANSFKVSKTDYSVDDVIKAAVNCVKSAIKECNKPETYVALDIGPTGKLLKPLGDTDFDDAYNAFKEMAVAGEKWGADCVIAETFTDTLELKAAVLAVKENTSLPLFTTCSFDENAKLLTGGSPEAVVALLEGLGVDALGINCSLGPKQLRPIFDRMVAVSSLPIVINPNAGLPEIIDGNTVYNVDAEEFSEDVLYFAENGASVIGGCCGTTPEHIAKTYEKCSKIVPKPITDKNLCVVSSYAKVQELGKMPVIIGERINPTGKKLFKEALRNNNIDYILSEGIAQQKSGAHILDVNVGLPEIDEKAVMLEAIEKIQGIIDLPLQIDTSSAEVMEAALRKYNGKAMINSVNGKQCEMEKIFPLVKKYGGVVVALTIDENGIPETAEGRYEIARKIVETAEKYGISKKDIVVDALTMTVSSSQDAARITLDALSMIKQRLGVKTVLGVSNVSFGLPNREVINSTFFALALYAGLDAGIINPNSEAMMNAYVSYLALKEYDENCQMYVERFSQMDKAETKKADKEFTLYDVIVSGWADKAYDFTVKKLETSAPTDIIDNIIVAALNEVGNGFEKKKIFLPQLMTSAKAAANAFDAIKDYLKNSGEKQEIRGRIAIATVKGDIHDIGKNIVKVMLENYGFKVDDLGKDVDCQYIADFVKENKIKLLGLSALMTTTVPYMEETIKIIHNMGLDCKIMVGGAVLTPEYAQMINADFYGKDAMASVNYANQVFDDKK